MDNFLVLRFLLIFSPIMLMSFMVLLARSHFVATQKLWRVFEIFSYSALMMIIFARFMNASEAIVGSLLKVTSLSLLIACMVQLLGTVICAFSARYLSGEMGQRGYIESLAGVLASVQILLMADHWLILIIAWSLVGIALKNLLCFYESRSFAQLAAHKKRITDWTADGLLLIAAGLAWFDVGSGSLSVLFADVSQHGLSMTLQLSTLALVSAVILRTGLMPVHGWLTQVMEAPTPVSALLHAGVINLGGFVLIRFEPLLEQATLARVILLIFGLTTAVLAGLVMLTRISIKVRLAWSTIAQMGFMVLECSLGLYTIAAIHLVGHSLYKANAFLSASEIVRHTRIKSLQSPASPNLLIIIFAPVLTIMTVFAVVTVSNTPYLPWWWNMVLGLAWAPLLWIPTTGKNVSEIVAQIGLGLMVLVGLTSVTVLVHGLPLGITDSPHQHLGLIALLGMFTLYVSQAIIQKRPAMLSNWRRWSYAGFYVDEAYTRLALKISSILGISTRRHHAPQKAIENIVEHSISHTTKPELTH